MKYKVMQTISEKIKNKIKRGKLYFISDFSKYGDSKTVSRILLQLSKSNFVVRLLRGVYFYPYIDKELGLLLCSWETVAKEIAKRKNMHLAQTAPYAQNKLGLSTQVPCNVVYLTDGKSRTIYDLKGRRVIRFIHTAPINFKYKSEFVQLIVFALDDFGEDSFNRYIKNGYEFNRVKTALLAQVTKEIVFSDLQYAPVWIQNVIKSFYD
jgi:hypothetical protein